MTSTSGTTRGGVADYFAVLGVGDELVWKHTQKQSLFDGPLETQDDTEEEYRERFYREIMDITILMEETEASSQGDSSSVHRRVPSDASTNVSLSQGGTLLHNAISNVTSYQTEGTANSQDGAVSLPSPPSRSEATTQEDSSDHMMANQLPETTNAQGWTILQRTLPTSKAAYIPLHERDARGTLSTSTLSRGPTLWHRYQTWDANLDTQTGIQQKLQQIQAKALHTQQDTDETLPLKSLRLKVRSTLRGWNAAKKRTTRPDDKTRQFYIAYRRRRSQDDNRPAVASVELFYVRLHRKAISENLDSALPKERSDSHLPALATHLLPNYQSLAKHPTPNDKVQEKWLDLQQHLVLPTSWDEWAIPEQYRFVRDMTGTRPQNSKRTILFENENSKGCSGGSGVGVEAIDSISDMLAGDPDALRPKLVSSHEKIADSEIYCFIPVLAIRRQRNGYEECFSEDSAMVDLAVSVVDGLGHVVWPNESQEDDGAEDDSSFRLLELSPWCHATDGSSAFEQRARFSSKKRAFGSIVLLARRNLPFGFADVAFATRVQGRFPFQNYKGLPFPEEELPMFCYPTGCRLHRARFCDAPLPQYYGFVVKNERGDSIFVSCVSFMEPLTAKKNLQLRNLSKKRKKASLAHRRFCEDRVLMQNNALAKQDENYIGSDTSDADCNLLTGFDDMMTFENKTICLVSRYPFWTAHRKFLCHLHTLSTSSLEIPLERYISHFLLAVPIPRPGGPCVLVPLPASINPMILSIPPEKDFPMIDLRYEQLVACLNVKTIVMIVLGMLTLERKVIVMSTRPSFVLDVCELLRSLLFPFDLCAPYVPRLTEPFKSSLDFPGAIFVGIHDDGSARGLAAKVRAQLPEESIIVDLDTGNIDCDGDKHTLVKTTWDVIPESARSALVSELQTLCRDAAIADGQEPLDSYYDSAFDVSLTAAVEDASINADLKEQLDDRAIRDAFLRFFCSVMGGYERYLVVPDADFLVSGDEWFDSQGFLASVSPDSATYLSALLSTQLFQAFVQKRTEASDVHCLLFDECLAEFHASPVPYGRLGGDVETVESEANGQPQMLYSLLVDQAANFPLDHNPSMLTINKSLDASEAESTLSKGFVESLSRNAESTINASGDIVTAASRRGLPSGARFIYCIDGNPCFPHRLKSELLLPKEPESWLVEVSKAPNPLLSRSERELEEATRRRRLATTYRGLQGQRRCLWQLPKLMGSHFLGSWLLCIPARVSQGELSHEQQSKYLLQALGALRLLRSKQRIVPDEASYRALMVACGRTQSDRRLELVKLFGLLRSDGIFPSAVTLGQYTKALAEGYSKRPSGRDQDDNCGGVEVADSSSRVGFSVTGISLRGGKENDISLSSLDASLGNLESQGRHWRQKSGSERIGEHSQQSKKMRANQPWLPTVFSSSFAPSTTTDTAIECESDILLVAIWSRTRFCSNCSYLPLEEEIQAGWDIVGGENDVPGSVACPRCGSLILPKLGYSEMTIDEALSSETESSEDSDFDQVDKADFANLPPQIRPTLDATKNASYVSYLSPATLRRSLEQYIELHGEEVLIRDRLRALDPEVYYNFWWYCARFALPFPLPVVALESETPLHYCAFAAWDRSAAERGCQSAAKVLALVSGRRAPFHRSAIANDIAPINPSEENPLLARFNLQGFYSTVWDHPDLSKILVALVEACDKRDFKPVVEGVLRCNERRKKQFGECDVSDTVSDFQSDADSSCSHAGVSSIEFDVYGTILYLAKYQCTTAFHTFFPTTAKACKGYHFWCAIGTPLPIFDRLMRDALRRICSGKEQAIISPIHEVSEVALGFRCVFGHLI